MLEPHSVYISGPMRGHDDFNFPAFFDAEDHLHKRFPDATVCNPAREDANRLGTQGQQLLDHDPTGALLGRYLVDNPLMFTADDLRTSLGDDLQFITAFCDLMVVLPGWEASKGATAEVAAAKALNIPMVEYSPELRTFMVEASHPTVSNGEVRTTSVTGGQKGTKLAAFDQVSPMVETLIAEHFGKGARKYSAHNFRKGYEWSKSYSALRRHLSDFWGGEDYDNHKPECAPDCTEHTGSLHIIAAAWHVMVLAEFFHTHPEFDDRYAVHPDYQPPSGGEK